MKFRTEIKVERFAEPIDHSARVFSVGSCFAEAISGKLARSKFHVASNPFGVLYNPLSIAEAIESLAEGKIFTRSDLVFSGERWFSYAHHGSFSAAEPEQALAKINEAARGGAEALARADVVIITFGTAWVWELGGAVVANCHKQPASLFTRRRLSVGEITERFSALLQGSLRGKRVIFTVSPVRHLADGFAENSLSKAILRVAVGELVERHPNASYFPAYEVVSDDLRDYRFYARDLVHPSGEAVDYVWEKFVEAVVDEHTWALLPRIEAIQKALEHRPFNTDTESHRLFRQNVAQKARELHRECPDIDFSDEIAGWM
ncbi:MAG: GSCFA domain-containing protein [Rikenellaceae bacterium]|jgi:hypothetical protein|nr:GSCFA domain-containing protein [Rikenellaceae bacterium]